MGVANYGWAQTYYVTPRAGSRMGRGPAQFDYLPRPIVGSLPILLVGFVAGRAPRPTIASANRDQEGAQVATVSQDRPTVYMTLGDHWSYIGVGWLLGLESVAASIEDALALADSTLGVKTSLNLDAHAYERLAVEFPELIELLKVALADKKMDVVGGSFAQPLASTVSGESNVRQLVVGREAIARTLDYDVQVFLEEEEFSHPQLPQLLVGAGYRYASLAQSDTFGQQGVPFHRVPVIEWEAKDGTSITAATRNALVLHTYKVAWAELLASDGFRELADTAPPLITKWDEFGWDVDSDPHYPLLEANLSTLADLCDLRFVTISEYLDASTYVPERVYLSADTYKRLLAWGVGGDQIRIADRRVEAMLRAAESFDAIAHLLGGRSRHEALGEAWRSLLTAQSHDVALCEHTVHVRGIMPPRRRMENFHNASWGAIGFQALSAAEAEAKRLSTTAVAFIAKLIAPLSAPGVQTQVAVFNPSAVDRSDIGTTGTLRGIPDSCTDIRIVDAEGRPVPSQFVSRRVDASGAMVAAEVEFAASDVPALGYATFGVVYDDEPGEPAANDLVIREDELQLENAFLLVELDTRGGGIKRLLDKRSGQEHVDGTKFPFPRFHGKRNPDFPMTSLLGYPEATSFAWDGRKGVPEHGPVGECEYDTADVDATVEWIERGPLRATVKLTSKLPLIHLETYVTLVACTPWVTVKVRLAADVPPATGIDKPVKDPIPVNFPIEGYWLSLAPAFEATAVFRDAPFCIEETHESAFHALTMIDYVGKDAALLVAHAGTQYFSLEGNVISNLVMREWESYFSNTFGWPPLAEYEYALMPHDPELRNAERIRMADVVARNFKSVTVDPARGTLAARQGFVSIAGAEADLTCLRVAEDGRLELRLVEYEGAEGTIRINYPSSLESAVETDIAGRDRNEVEAGPGQAMLRLRPYGVHTLRADIRSPAPGSSE